MGISTVMFLIFLVLKLCKIITWSWWLVTAPLWAELILELAIIITTVMISKR